MLRDPNSGLLARRDLLGGLISVGGLMAAGPAFARAVSGPQLQSIAFDIRRDGASIGLHVVNFRRVGERLEVDIEIDISINLAIIPVFSYRHRNHEVWQSDRLVSLDSTTDDDGREFAVTARAVGGQLQIVGSDGQIAAPADILPTSYWDPRTVAQTRLLDSQRGRILAVAPRSLGEETLPDGSPARRYRLSGDLDLDLWYSPSGEWLKTAFEARGATVSYARREAMAGGVSG